MPGPMPQPSTAASTWAVVWSGAVLTGGVNPRRIDGMDGVAGGSKLKQGSVEGGPLAGVGTQADEVDYESD